MMKEKKRGMAPAEKNDVLADAAAEPDIAVVAGAGRHDSRQTC